MLEVTSAEHAGDFRLQLSFTNGESGVVDLEKSLWGPVFEPLKDPRQFRRFIVSETLHTVSWENGADFAPEYLYAKMVEQGHVLQRP
jgi:hypothetical protein